MEGATSAAPALAIAAAPAETPIRRAYREMAAFREQVEGANLTDEEVDAASDSLRTQLARLVALPSQGAADTLTKFYAVVEDTLCLRGQAEEATLMAEAARFVKGEAA